MMMPDYDPYEHLQELEKNLHQTIDNVRQLSEIVKHQGFLINQLTDYIKHQSRSIDVQLSRIRRLEQQITEDRQ